MNTPLVSINIPCYNRKDMLRECIETFIMQTFEDWELIVADDGSKDDLTFVTEMDDRVKYFRQGRLGISKAFNLALDNSVGKYIMPFGSDDLATPNFVGEMVKVMEAYNPDVAYCNSWRQRGDGKLQRQLSSKVLNIDIAYQNMLRRQYISHGGSIWLKETMPRYDESLESAVDWELYLTAMERRLKFKHRKCKLWIHRMGHEREEMTERQNNCCDRLLRKRGYKFNPKTRQGEKI